MYFFRVRLARGNDVFWLNSIPDNYAYLYRPIDNILYILNHQHLHLDVVKIDIDGDEWDTISKTFCTVSSLLYSF